MAAESPVLRDDHGRKIHVGGGAGTVTISITCGMTSVLASLSGERLDAVREAIGRAATPGQPSARGDG